MSTPDPTPPMPPDFGIRYVLWFIWCNSITLLQVIQTATATLLVASDPDAPNPLIPHTVLKVVVLSNAVLTGIIAQVKRNNPPGPPPTKQAP